MNLTVRSTGHVAAWLVVAVLAMGAGYARLTPCLAGGWDKPVELGAVCYSDIAIIYERRGGQFPAMPYRNYIFEYPVGTGGFVYATSAVTAGLQKLGAPGGDTFVYFTLSALLLAMCGVAAVRWTTAVPGTRRGDVAYLSFGLAAMAFVNWDLLPVALTAAAVYAWTRKQPLACGALIGWGAATKAYPVLLLVALLLICMRERQFRVFAQVAVAAVLTWLALNIGYLVGPLHSGWTLFYTFSFHREASLGTVWHLLDHTLPGHWAADHLTLLVSASLTALTLGIAALALLAPRTPTLGQLTFLMVAAFLLTSKTWSPQYGLWLLPFAVLTRLPWRVLIGWLVADLAFYVAGMWYVNWQIHGAGPKVDFDQALVVVGIHWAALAAVSGLVVRDMLQRQPEEARSGHGSIAVAR
jgi:uncharacterized membrane protein